MAKKTSKAKKVVGKAFANKSLPTQILNKNLKGGNLISKTFTIGQVAKALRCHERSARGYLYEINQSIDRYTSNLAEAVDYMTVMTLCLAHSDSSLGRRLVPLLA